MYALCVSGAVNTQGFVWKFFYALYINFHSFIHSRGRTNKQKSWKIKIAVINQRERGERCCHYPARLRRPLCVPVQEQFTTVSVYTHCPSWPGVIYVCQFRNSLRQSVTLPKLTRRHLCVPVQEQFATVSVYTHCPSWPGKNKLDETERQTESEREIRIHLPFQSSFGSIPCNNLQDPVTPL